MQGAFSHDRHPAEDAGAVRLLFCSALSWTGLRKSPGLAQVKMLEGGGFSHESVAEFLNKAVEPPPEISVANAVRLLQDIGAFEVSTLHH